MLKFRELWGNHPTNHGEQFPCHTGGTSHFANQCSIRMGVCLKRCGVQVAQLRGAITCNQAGGVAHPAEDMHFVRANELANALRGARIDGLGSMVKLASATNFAEELGGRTGIIYFQDYWWRTTDILKATGDHIDLWNGWRTTAKMLFPWFGWLGGYDRSGEIWFWEVR